MSNELAEPAYCCDLGNGLVKRWSTEKDTHNIAQFVGSIFQSTLPGWSKQDVMDSVYPHMRPDSFVGGPGEVALIEDSHKDGNPIVATCALWHQTWEYEGIAFPVGRPEWCGTDPVYRGRGFCRMLVEMLHARSEMRKHLAQVVIGTPNLWRHLGYEYGLEFGSYHVMHVSLIPRQREQTSEPCRFRRAVIADLPFIEDLYQRRKQAGIVRTTIPQAYWRYYIEQGGSETARRFRPNVQIIVDRNEKVCGYALLNSTRRGRDVAVFALEAAPDIDWASLMFPLLRVFQHYGITIPVSQPDIEPLSEIHFYLDRDHPLLTTLGPRLLSTYASPSAWYVRVPDIIAFLQHIVPILEKRLSSSPFSAFTGALHLNFYRGGLCIHFERGCIARIEDEQDLRFFHPVSARFPAPIFWKLLFGYRSLAELRYMYPDILTTNTAEVLLNALFPTGPSWAMQLA